MIYDLETGTRRRSSTYARRRSRLPRLPRLNTLLTIALMLAILVVGGYLRSINLANWDERQGLHPDERFVSVAVSNLSLPTSLGQYWDSANSTLNPRNFDWSRMWVYGTLPTTITRVVATIIDRPQDVLVVGRALSGFFDLVACVALFALGRLLHGRKAGLLAAALYALTVMSIQQAHFFTTDNFAVAFATLALVSATRLGLYGRWRDALLAGLWTGAAVASKINLAAMAAIIGLAALQYYARRFAQATSDPTTSRGAGLRTLVRPALLLAAAGAVTFVAFRVFQPDAFSGPNFWNIRPEARFLDNLRTVRGLVDGTVDMPPSHQWASHTPYLWPLQNMIVWGMGVPLGVMAWLAWGVAGIRMVRRGRRGITTLIGWRYLVPWVWIALYWAWQGRGFNPSLRYFLPIYPALVLFAAIGSLEAGRWLRVRLAQRARRLLPMRRSLISLAPTIVLLVCTACWAWGFTRIYTRPHSRVEAGEWMVANAPHRTFLTTEQWDDALPFTNGNGNGCDPFCYVETTPYAEDEPSKYVGRGETLTNEQVNPNPNPDGLIAQLERADYVVLSSARIYSSIERLPHRFPVALRYYDTLFDGSLGFDLEADFHSFPSFLGLPVPDLGAEEQFTVYDHPRVLIFRKTERFNAQLARDLLTRDVVWSEMYRISAKLTSAAPNALRVTAHNWERLEETNSAYLWQPGLVARALTTIGIPFAATITGVIALLLALELLALATFGIVRRWRVPLPDGGVVSSRILGLLLFAAPLAALALVDRLTVSRTIMGVWYGLLVGFGLRLLWSERHTLGALWQRHRSIVLWGNGLYAVALLIGLAVRAFGPELPTTATGFGSAQWAAMVRSPILPPPDPVFAGGQIETPYAALVPFATLTRLVGVAPLIAYNVWLAVLVALLASLAWALTGRVRPRLFAVVTGMLVLAPGFLAGTATPLGALGTANIAVLAGAVLAATALVFTRAITLPSGPEPRRWRTMVTIAPFVVALVALTFLRAQQPWSFWAVVATIVALMATARPVRLTLTAVRAIALVLVPLVLAHPLNVVAPTTNIISIPVTGTLVDSPLGFAVQFILALIVLVGVAASVGSRLIDRRIIWGVGAATLIVLVAGSVIGLSPLIALSPLALLMLWLVLETGTSRGRLQRVAPAFFAAFAGVVLLMLGGRVVTQTLPGDGALMALVGLVLVVYATGALLPLVRIAPRIMPRLVQGAPAVVALALVVSIIGIRPSVLPQTDDPSALVAALVGDASNGGVVATASQGGLSPVIAQSGLSALAGDPDATITQRALLSPSINTVLDGRRSALQTIYGADASAAATQINTYAVDYVVVGPTERALYGASTGAALRELENIGSTSVIYEDADWTLFKRTTTVATVPFVQPTIDLGLPSTKDGLLDTPLRDLPVVDEYAWNQLANNNDFVAIALWLVLFEVLGLLTLPLASRIFGRSNDAGWAWSKLIGLAVWSYVIWLPVSLGWWTYRWWSLLIGLAILATLSWIAAGRPRTFGALWRRTLQRPDGTRAVWTEIARVEALYLLAFGVWAVVRMANPDLWHPWLGGEKPFEFGMLNAIVRSPVMPPPDPFFSGGVINYYYYGLFLVSVPMRATGIDPAVAFNLIVPTLFAFVLTGSAAIVRTLTGQWRWGLLGALMVGVLGPAASAVRFGESRGLPVVWNAIREGWSGWPSRIGDWFWGPSRIIPGTINEFPYFSYLFADLHPHMIALPVTILGIALAIELYRAPTLRRHGAALALAALVVGTLAAANSWDAPTSALIVGGALIGRAWRGVRRGTTLREKAWELGRAAIIAVGVLVVGLVLILPFFMNYQAMVGGIGRVRQSDTLLQWAMISGAHLYVALSLLVGITWAVVQRINRPLLRRSWRRTLATGVGSLLAMLLLGAWAFAAQPSTGGRFPILTVVLVVLVVLAVVLAFVARLRDEEWLVLWLVTAGLMVALGIQLVFVRDHLSGGDWERMNTVFKFGLQIWTLLALGAAAGMPMMLRLLRRWGDAAVSAWVGPLLLLLLMGATYPVIATPSRSALRFQEHPGLTLDGLAFMDSATYESDGHQLDLSGDALAIRWLKANVSGLPVIVQSEAEFYRANGIRIAANTGFPTVLGRLHEDEQRPAAGVIARENDVKTLFSTTDEIVATSLLAKYNVDYVYVGPAERAFYDQAGLAKWDTLEGRAMDTVYQNATVHIYRVRPGLQVSAAALPSIDTPAQPAQPAQPEQPAIDEGTVQELENAQEEQPNDPATAYTLANAYIQNGRLDDAARVLQSAAAANPQDIALHQFLGDIQARLGDADAAIAAWQQAADISPTSGNISKLGTGMTALGRYDEAEQVFQRAARADPNDAMVHFYLGENARKRNASGDPQRAREEYTLYLQQAPDDSPFRGVAEQALRELE